MKSLVASSAAVVLASLLAGCGTSSPSPHAGPAERRQPESSPELRPGTAPAPEPASTPPTPEPSPAPTPSPSKTPPPVREVFPGVRLDLSKRAVEFDGEIARGMGEGSVTYLEVLACRPNSREHESVVMTQALPSHLHAALLLAGALPGKPGSWTYDKEAKALIPHPPAGDDLIISVAWNADGTDVTRPLTELVRNIKDNSSLSSTRDGFVFAGSAFLQRRADRAYAADVSGTVIGLCTFGDEPIAWTRIISHEETVEDPVWVIGPAAPPPGTKVVVRIELPPSDAPAR